MYKLPDQKISSTSFLGLKNCYWQYNLVELKKQRTNFLTDKCPSNKVWMSGSFVNATRKRNIRKNQTAGRLRGDQKEGFQEELELYPTKFGCQEVFLIPPGRETSGRIRRQEGLEVIRRKNFRKNQNFIQPSLDVRKFS